MADESVNIQTIPMKGDSGSKIYSRQASPAKGQQILPHNSIYRLSIGSSNNGNSQRRNSTGKQSVTSNTQRNVLPNYLRASTGSCHDFCKFGKKEEVEVKPRRPMLKKRSVPPPTDKQGPTVVSDEQKKITVVKVKLSPPSKIRSPEPPEVIKREVFSSPKKVDPSSRKDVPKFSKVKEVEKKISKLSPKVASCAKSKSVALESGCSDKTPAGLHNKRSNNPKIGEKTGKARASQKKSLTSGAASLSPKSSLTTVVCSIAKKSKSMKMVMPLKDPSKVYNVQSRQTNVKKPLERVASLNARKFRGLKVHMPLKEPSRIQRAQTKQSNNEQVQEKTLHVVEAETKDNVLHSIQVGDALSSPLSLSSASTNPSSLSFHQEKTEEISEYTDSEDDDFVSETEEILDIDEEEIPEGFKEKISRKGGLVLNGDEDNAPVKMKFRRGKIIDLQYESNGPRRLRFRRGRMLGENQDNKAGTRSFKKRDTDAHADTNEMNPSMEKVTLRHQDVQGKKDEKGLFNNVIEETASKLVESRKSKVKALVGAFETVISLQDRKPST